MKKILMAVMFLSMVLLLTGDNYVPKEHNCEQNEVSEVIQYESINHAIDNGKIEIKKVILERM